MPTCKSCGKSEGLFWQKNGKSWVLYEPHFNGLPKRHRCGGIKALHDFYMLKRKMGRQCLKKWRQGQQNIAQNSETLGANPS
jgi:hypothetical protein